MTSLTRRPPGAAEILSGELGARGEPGPAHETRLTLAPTAFGRAARTLRDAGARLITLLLADTPEPALVGVCALHGELIVLRAPTGGDPIEYESLGAWWPAARWPEQELAERHGVRPAGATFDHPLTRPDADALDRRVDGLDAFVIPYGPVRSGVFEAIQFQIETGGETVARLQTRPFFKHRALEARCVAMAPDRAVYVAERVAGIATVAYAIAFSQAVERAVGVEPSAVAQRWRVVHAELERMACHLDVIAKEAETTALYVGHARFQIIKEQVMRLRAQLTGSRFGRGAVVPGGVRAPGAMALDQLRDALDVVERALVRDRRLFVGTASMTDRLIGAGRVGRELVESYSAVGPLARGSGVSTDARHERPYGGYRRLGVQVVTHREGDAMARVNVRFGELLESLRILRATIDHLRRGDGDLVTALPPRAAGAALGWAEAPQGELVAWVEVRDGLIHRVHLASPSLRNWALFDHAFSTDVLTDFAFIEHSFGLTPAGADR